MPLTLLIRNYLQLTIEALIDFTKKIVGHSLPGGIFSGASAFGHQFGMGLFFSINEVNKSK